MQALTDRTTTQYAAQHTPQTTSKRTKGLVEIPSTSLKYLCKSFFEKECDISGYLADQLYPATTFKLAFTR